ncbi:MULTISPECIES: CarD family transcriptional regulator [unclassified Clostridioides]|uniref:CarD family transcriptional regulator n=1 Tax=unclassified Clostridioides TaxID=2635829 RepID=UPI001D11B3EF|nr:CarD family transcriptional regulator [Clostridioides sp. ZZV14-6150]MCC0659733.1 CarD family transcriptional regulator [Clostridioides sp. ZZV14-6154]MCC0666752.1 CarD family transcriptional regulator [Clostridioides sp. ZZV14-6153]MCC0717774.1 CarD family transcriptional regulator [Clostridioides sp. ZZV14-6105]MCC0722873.1 CarD family transcriptional regulator [Clostridioides sp. ZZV14-6104]MCC0728184.1 CarD family transcriptional regulator [Clostridioides sp. ZZV14-6045]MCC0729214.1 Ca
MYNIGESVMYPKEGACYVSDIVTKEINKHMQKYYELTVIFNSTLKISIPVLNADKIGVRPIMNENEVNNFIQSIDKIDGIWIFDRKQRLKLYHDKFHSGDVFEIVKLIKMLMIQDCSKQLCSTDKDFLNKAQRFALSELAAAQCKSYTIVLEEMKKHILNPKSNN